MAELPPGRKVLPPLICLTNKKPDMTYNEIATQQTQLDKLTRTPIIEDQTQFKSHFEGNM